MQNFNVLLIVSACLAFFLLTEYQYISSQPHPSEVRYTRLYIDSAEIDSIAVAENNKLQKLITAIQFVESSFRWDAYNATTDAVGCMQITPIMVAEVNRIQDSITYTLQDRWDCNTSEEMFKIWVNVHHNNSNWETISRHWYGGPKYGEMKCSEFYWEKVKEYLITNIIFV